MYDKVLWDDCARSAGFGAMRVMVCAGFNNIQQYFVVNFHETLFSTNKENVNDFQI